MRKPEEYNYFTAVGQEQVDGEKDLPRMPIVGLRDHLNGRWVRTGRIRERDAKADRLRFFRVKAAAVCLKRLSRFHHSLIGSRALPFNPGD